MTLCERASFFIDAMDGGRHIKYAVRQLDAPAGLFVDDLIEQPQHEIVHVPRFQHLQLADVQIPPRRIRLLIEPVYDAAHGVPFRLHLHLVLENDEKAVPDRLARDMLSSTHHLNSSERRRLLLLSRMPRIMLESTSQRYLEASLVSRYLQSWRTASITKIA